VKELIRAFCILVDIKPKRKGKPYGEIDIDYFCSFHTLMVNNKILILVKSTNKYALAIENILKAWKIIG
jgi:hypothetical protein